MFMILITPPNLYFVRISCGVLILGLPTWLDPSNSFSLSSAANTNIQSLNNYKKLGRRGNDRPRGIVWWRRPSHTSQENPRTSAPPLHSGTVAHVRRPRPEPGLRPMLWHYGTDKGIFLTSTWNSLTREVELRTWGVPLGSSNQLT